MAAQPPWHATSSGAQVSAATSLRPPHALDNPQMAMANAVRRTAVEPICEREGRAMGSRDQKVRPTRPSLRRTGAACSDAEITDGVRCGGADTKPLVTLKWARPDVQVESLVRTGRDHQKLARRRSRCAGPSRTASITVCAAGCAGHARSRVCAGRRWVAALRGAAISFSPRARSLPQPVPAMTARRDGPTSLVLEDSPCESGTVAAVCKAACPSKGHRHWRAAVVRRAIPELPKLVRSPAFHHPARE